MSVHEWESSCDGLECSRCYALAYLDVVDGVPTIEGLDAPCEPRTSPELVPGLRKSFQDAYTNPDLRRDLRGEDIQ